MKKYYRNDEKVRELEWEIRNEKCEIEIVAEWRKMNGVRMRIANKELEWELVELKKIFY